MFVVNNNNNKKYKRIGFNHCLISAKFTDLNAIHEHTQ